MGAVCAQIAGSIYGVTAIPPKWIRAVQRWDDGLTALKVVCVRVCCVCCVCGGVDW